MILETFPMPLIYSRLERTQLAHTASHEICRAAPFFFPPAPILLPDNSKHLTDLYIDNRPATCLLDNKRLVNQFVQIARFHSFTLKVSLVCLACLLASIGQLAPRNQHIAYSIATSRGSFDSSEAETMLECAHCDVLIPLEDLARHKPRSSLTLTAELLSQVLEPQHLEQCCGRLAGKLLREDDTKMSVAAVSEFGLFPSKTIDSLSGMPMPSLLICSIACSIIGGYAVLFMISYFCAFLINLFTILLRNTTYYKNAVFNLYYELRVRGKDCKVLVLLYRLLCTITVYMYSEHDVSIYFITIV